MGSTSQLLKNLKSEIIVSRGSVAIFLSLDWIRTFFTFIFFRPVSFYSGLAAIPVVLIEHLPISPELVIIRKSFTYFTKISFSTKGTRYPRSILYAD